MDALDVQAPCAGRLEQPTNSEASNAATISGVYFFINVNDAERSGSAGLRPWRLDCTATLLRGLLPVLLGIRKLTDRKLLFMGSHLLDAPRVNQRQVRQAWPPRSQRDPVVRNFAADRRIPIALHEGLLRPPEFIHQIACHRMAGAATIAQQSFRNVTPA